MAEKLRITFAPIAIRDERLEQFVARLRAVLLECGCRVCTIENACGTDGRISPGTAIIAPGSTTDRDLPINRVSTLYDNIIVGIFNEPPPVQPGEPPQKTLDAVVGRLAWEMVHLLIYVTDDAWTICGMNGGVTTCETSLPGRDDVLGKLVPKLTAQVVPPKAGEIDIRHGGFDTADPAFTDIAADFVECGRLWHGNPVLTSHTSPATLTYRSERYRRIVARYLDDRNGMSYGFFARQLPTAAAPAVEEPAHYEPVPGEASVGIRIAGKQYIVPVPEVRVITTRSGCRKTELDSRTDLVETGLSRGRVWIATPSNLTSEQPVRPSFDTLTIVAHALGNALVASLLQTLRPGSAAFPERLARSGASMTHWHDYPETASVPKGYIVHGTDNPPVSCSTPQSAAYSLLGKLEALDRAISEGKAYLGDLHIEPGHGTNLVGVLSLTETAAWMNRRQRQPAGGSA